MNTEPFIIEKNSNGYASVSSIRDVSSSSLLLGYCLLTDRLSEYSNFRRLNISVDDYNAIVLPYLDRGLKSGFGMLIHSDKEPYWDRLEQLKADQPDTFKVLTDDVVRDIKRVRKEVRLAKPVCSFITKENSIEALTSQLDIMSSIFRYLQDILSIRQCFSVFQTISKIIHDGSFKTSTNGEIITIKIQNFNVFTSLKEHSEKMKSPSKNSNETHK